MGGAIVAGAVRSGVVAASDAMIASPHSKLADRLRVEGFDVGYVQDNRQAVERADMVVVAVKPWLMEQVLGEIADLLDRSRQSLVSIAAGVSFDMLSAYLRSTQLGDMGMYRIIPNTAIAIGKSVTFIASQGTTADQDSQVERLFVALGSVFKITEDDIFAVTALSSSGIAYAYKYIDSAMRGGVRMGIEQSEALDIVLQTMKGAVAMLEANGSLPQAEINKVTTPGGITLKGLKAMEEDGFTEAVIAGLLATKFD